MSAQILNQLTLGRHEGMFSPFSFDVSNMIDADRNWHKGRNMLMVKLDPPPQVNHKVAGLKTPWFGDYWRDLVPFGIWRPVRLVATGKVRVDDLYVKSKLSTDGAADVQIEVTLENHGEQTREVTLPIVLRGKNFSGPEHNGEIHASIEPGLQTLKTTMQVKNPQLWWPWDLGKPNLYTAKLRVEEGGQVHDRSETTFGIRQIKMAWNPGFTKDEVSFPRTVKLNGKTHFIRSACWGGPPDILVGRTSPKEYKDCKIKLGVTDENDSRLHEQSIDVASISADSSTALTEVTWRIAGLVEKQFHVHLSLLDVDGKKLSENRYMLLIGDQADARKRMKAMGHQQGERNKAFTYGNYYRFFPDMIQQNDKDWQSQTQTPRANVSSPERSKERRHDED